MIDQKDTYAIVILGGMNPRIHQSSWYRLVGLFDEEEAEEATKAPNTLLTPLFAQIQTPKLTIVCHDNRWEIKTTDLDQVGRIQEITSKLFDDLLPHTPIAAAGFNFMYWRTCHVRDVGDFLASALINAPLGLKGDNAVSAEVLLQRAYDDRTASVQLRPVREEKQKLFLHFNFEYQFRAEGFFKLGNVIAQRYGVDRSESDEQVALILESIKRSARG